MTDKTVSPLERICPPTLLASEDGALFWTDGVVIYKLRKYGDRFRYRSLDSREEPCPYRVWPLYAIVDQGGKHRFISGTDDGGLKEFHPRRPKAKRWSSFDIPLAMLTPMRVVFLPSDGTIAVERCGRDFDKEARDLFLGRRR